MSQATEGGLDGSVCVWGGGDAVFLGQVSVGDRSDFRERKPASIPDTRN